MSSMRFTPSASTSTYAASVERHFTWAREYVLAGDLEAAMDAIRDAHAIATEVTEDEA